MATANSGLPASIDAFTSVVPGTEEIIAFTFSLTARIVFRSAPYISNGIGAITDPLTILSVLKQF
ncbi:hypothetical protein [Chryseobacterium sp.]|uniref:hypothetical protein n=1 Tax=Chryseobacterium sp. TaxID=1871047 RepID=UPI00321B9D7B